MFWCFYIHFSPYCTRHFFSLVITFLSFLSRFTFFHFFVVACWFINLTFYSLTKPHSTYGSSSRAAMTLSYFLPHHLKIQLLFFWFIITTNADVVSNFLIGSGFSLRRFSAACILTNRATPAVGVAPQGTMQSHYYHWGETFERRLFPALMRLTTSLPWTSFLRLLVQNRPYPDVRSKYEECRLF